MSDDELYRKVRDVSALILLVCFWGWVCRFYGYVPVPLWLILTPMGLVILFWGSAVLLGFISWVICVVKKIDKEIEEKKRQQNNEELW